jgi:hypothetical protein
MPTLAEMVKGGKVTLWASSLIVSFFENKETCLTKSLKWVFLITTACGIELPLPFLKKN